LLPMVSAAPGFRLVMSVLAPLAAAPRLVLAVGALLAPVPPLLTARGLVSVRLAKVGLEPTAKL
jgi:hypothetical protein